MEFFDVLYLGIFITLSPAFDSRFYQSTEPPPAIFQEVSYALSRFQLLLNDFSNQFTILLGGEAVASSYVLNRMLAEFAAAAVVFAQEIHEYRYQGEDDVLFKLRGEVEWILQGSHSEVFSYYSHCLKEGHRDFLWTGPEVQILPRSADLDENFMSAAPGELLDLPGHYIYHRPTTTAGGTRLLNRPLGTASPPTKTLCRTRRKSKGESIDDRQTKRLKQ